MNGGLYFEIAKTFHTPHELNFRLTNICKELDGIAPERHELRGLPIKNPKLIEELWEWFDEVDLYNLMQLYRQALKAEAADSTVENKKISRDILILLQYGCWILAAVECGFNQKELFEQINKGYDCTQKFTDATNRYTSAAYFDSISKEGNTFAKIYHHNERYRAPLKKELDNISDLTPQQKLQIPIGRTYKHIDTVQNVLKKPLEENSRRVLKQINQQACQMVYGVVNQVKRHEMISPHSAFLMWLKELVSNFCSLFNPAKTPMPAASTPKASSSLFMHKTDVKQNQHDQQDSTQDQDKDQLDEKHSENSQTFDKT